jgi:hypothetical protein
VKTVDFPLQRAGVTREVSDLRRLSRLLRESALLLEACRGSSDSEFRAGSIDLAIRTMRAASLAVDRSSDAASREDGPARTVAAAASVVEGPWINPAPQRESL